MKKRIVLALVLAAVMILTGASVALAKPGTDVKTITFDLEGTCSIFDPATQTGTDIPASATFTGNIQKKGDDLHLSPLHGMLTSSEAGEEIDHNIMVKLVKQSEPVIRMVHEDYVDEDNWWKYVNWIAFVEVSGGGAKTIGQLSWNIDKGESGGLPFEYTSSDLFFEGIVDGMRVDCWLGGEFPSIE